MSPRIEVGRKRFRNSLAIEPSKKGMLVVDCTKKIKKDPFRKSGQGTVPIPTVAAKLEQVYGQVFLDVVDEVVQAVVNGLDVHVRCLMGINRSQAVAWRAREKLRQEHPAIPFEGPVCLPGLVSRIPE